MVSVIIAQRSEPYLRQTVASIVKSCGGKRPEIIVVNDGAQEKQPDVPKWVRVETPWDVARGCMAARDWGIVNAEHPACVIIDGHMDFDVGLFAGYRDRLDEHPQDVLCAHCPGLNPVTWTRQAHVCSGAFVLWQDKPTCLSLKWRYTYDTGEVPAILGACYGIHREWYMDGLQRPWQYGTGWGTDEELLSIANWLCGGRNIVTEWEAAHWFREQKQVPYPMDALAAYGQYANRIRMVKMIPMAEDWKRELLDPLEKMHAVQDGKRILDQMLKERPPDDYHSWLSMQARTFAQWRDLWCPPGNPQDAGSQQPKGLKVQPLKYGVLPGTPADGTTTMAPMDAIGMAPFPPIGEVVTRKAPQPNIVVVDPGIRCPHCHARYNHNVTHTYPNGNRRRLCHECGMPFISIRDSR